MPVLPTKTYMAVEVWLHAYLNLEVDGGECLALCPVSTKYELRFYGHQVVV